jgi:hypothetical protein
VISDRCSVKQPWTGEGNEPLRRGGRRGSAEKRKRPLAPVSQPSDRPGAGVPQFQHSEKTPSTCSLQTGQVQSGLVGESAAAWRNSRMMAFARASSALSSTHSSG